jgi:predicted small lipoprotein YifL
MRRAWRAMPLAFALLAGCGMYGSLYLEEEIPPAPEITEAPPTAAEEPADAPDVEPRPDDEEDPAGAS